MAALRSGILVIITGLLIASFLSFAYADDVIYPGGMVIPKFNSSMIASMHPAEKFNSSEIASMSPAEKFNSSMIATMQKANSTVPLPAGISI